MIDYEKQEPFISWNPRDLIEKHKVQFHIPDLDLIIDATNWPENLILNPELRYSEEMFYEQFCCDTTLSFYTMSAIDRVKSLISRATHNPETKWEHGLINFYAIDEECPEKWMKKSITNLALKEIK
jgi:hypothetical protein